MAFRRVWIVAVADALHVLVFRQEGIRDTCREHLWSCQYWGIPLSVPRPGRGGLHQWLATRWLLCLPWLRAAIGESMAETRRESSGCFGVVMGGGPAVGADDGERKKRRKVALSGELRGCCYRIWDITRVNTGLLPMRSCRGESLPKYTRDNQNIPLIFTVWHGSNY